MNSAISSQRSPRRHTLQFPPSWLRPKIRPFSWSYHSSFWVHWWGAIGSRSSARSTQWYQCCWLSLQCCQVVEHLFELKFALQIYVELTSYTLIPAIKNCAKMTFQELSMGTSGSHLNMIHTAWIWYTTTIEESFGG